MKNYITVLASFVIMLCLGGVYAWSFFVPLLKESYGFTSTQTQIVFGVLIGVFSIAMLFGNRLEKKFGARMLTIASAFCLAVGYILAGKSGGAFFLILVGIGVLGGMGTGFGYLVALTTPVRWFPQKKGLVTGLAAAGFGIAAVILSNVAAGWVENGKTVLEIFTMLGIGYGTIIFVLSFLIFTPVADTSIKAPEIKAFLSDPRFLKLLFGMLCGTFAGLLVIGNLKPIGAEYAIDNSTLVLGISVFALSNFAGRIIWGAVSDYVGAKWSISLALAIQAVAIFLLGFLGLTAFSYLTLAAIIGFSFGANFVLFAKETAQTFGVGNLAALYPYVFLGYGISGILGPITGGVIYDAFANYAYAAAIAAGISLVGGLIFLDMKSVFGRKSTV
jgi:OFA family oxalate/formate antiporter-like MFS transporter